MQLWLRALYNQTRSSNIQYFSGHERTFHYLKKLFEKVAAIARKQAANNKFGLKAICVTKTAHLMYFLFKRSKRFFQKNVFVNCRF